MRDSSRSSCFCAYCGSQRVVYNQKHIGATNVLLCFLFSTLVMFGSWGSIDPRMLMVFVISLCFSEVFIQVRWRLSLTCNHCGFDPIVYMKDPKRAAAKVRAFFEEKSQRAEFFFTESLLLKKARQYQVKKSWEEPMDSGQHDAGPPPSIESEATSHFQLKETEELVDQGLTRT